MRWPVVAILGVLACSGGPDEQVPDAGPDGPPPDSADGCLGCDAPVACLPWALEDRPATALALLDEPSPIAAGISLRGISASRNNDRANGNTANTTTNNDTPP